MKDIILIIAVVCLLLSGCSLFNKNKYYYKSFENYYEKVRQDPENLDLQRELAEAYIKKRKIEAAYEVYQYVLKKDPNDYKSFNDAGFLFYYKANNTRHDPEKQEYYFKRALENYNKAIELKPDYARAVFNKGYIMQRLGKAQEAITLYNEALKLDPDIMEANNNLGVIYLCDIKDNKKGYEYILKATRQDPGCIKRYGQAFGNLIYAKEVNKIGTVTLFDKFKVMYTGVKNATPSKYKKFCEMPSYKYKPLLSKDIISPDDEFPFEKKPQSAKDYYKLAKYYEKRNCYDLAIKSNDKCIEKDKKYYDAYLFAETMYRSKANLNSDKKKAEEYIDKVLELNPEYVPALKRVANRYSEMRQNKDKSWDIVITDPKYIDYIDKILKIEPDDYWALFNKGEYYQYQKKEFEKAREYYLKCKKVNPEYTSIVNEKLAEMGLKE